MGYAGAKRSSISPALWVALAALGFASLTAAKNIEQPEVSDADARFRAAIVEAAWNAAKDVDMGIPYPQAVAERVTEVVKSSTRQGTKFDMMVYRDETPSGEIEKPTTNFAYLKGLKELTVEHKGHQYSINVFETGTFQTCERWWDDTSYFYITNELTRFILGCKPQAPGATPACPGLQQCTYNWSPLPPDSPPSEYGVLPVEG